MKVNLTGVDLDILHDIYIIKFPELTERQLEGLFVSEGESILNALHIETLDNELAVYKSKGLSDSKWIEYKLEWLEQWKLHKSKKETECTTKHSTN